MWYSLAGIPYSGVYYWFCVMVRFRRIGNWQCSAEERSRVWMTKQIVYYLLLLLYLLLFYFRKMNMMLRDGIIIIINYYYLLLLLLSSSPLLPPVLLFFFPSLFYVYQSTTTTPTTINIALTQTQRRCCCCYCCVVSWPVVDPPITTGRWRPWRRSSRRSFLRIVPSFTRSLVASVGPQQSPYFIPSTRCG